MRRLRGFLSVVFAVPGRLVVRYGELFDVGVAAAQSVAAAIYRAFPSRLSVLEACPIVDATYKEASVLIISCVTPIGSDG